MKNKTTSLNEKTIKDIENCFPTVYSGLKISAESFLVLRRFAKEEIKGIFNRAELSALVDMYNSTIFDPKLSNKNTLIIEIEDSELYEGTLTKWKVDKTNFLIKINKLSDIQAFFIIFECNFFWEKNLNNKISLNSFIDIYVKK